MENLILSETWVVVGGGGQLGRSLKSALSLHGKKHYVLPHDQVDITNQESVSELFHKYKPNVLINAAAWTNVNAAEENAKNVFEVNSHAPKLLAIESSKFDTTFVQISTDYIFSGMRDVPWSETDQPHPISIYGKSKFAGEQNVIEYCNSPYYIVRTAWLYSDFGPNFVKQIIRKYFATSEPFGVISNEYGQPTSSSDLADQLILLVDSRVTSGIFHGTNAGEASRWEFASKILELLELDLGRIFPTVGNGAEVIGIRPKYSVLSHDNWKLSNLSCMRHWTEALKSALPAIYTTTKNER